MPPVPALQVLRPGDTTKPDPFTILLVANPALQAMQNGNVIFKPDPLLTDPVAFQQSAQYVDAALFGNLPNQRERLLAEPDVGPRVRLAALFMPDLPVEDANALVSEYRFGGILEPRRAIINAFLQRFGLAADIVYAITQSPTHQRAAAWFTSDDEAGPGVSFTLDSQTLVHRHFCQIPGTIAMHAANRSLTAVHEFAHALSSFENGQITDLYTDLDSGVNRKRGRPIPTSFAVYNGVALAADQTRNGLGYPDGWQSYHCELLDSGFPALMDNYRDESVNVPEHCQHDRFTRQFLLDRLRAKLAR